MKRLAIMSAQNEAKRFTEKAIEFWKMDRKAQAIKKIDDDFITDRSPEAAALKRASMDLSRALSMLRKGGF
jgi:hypothetical protein